MEEAERLCDRIAILHRGHILAEGVVGDAEGDLARTGWQSPSRWAPSALTRLSDRATARNNELPESA